MICAENLYLAPLPKRLLQREGTFHREGRRYIKLEAACPQSVLPAAKHTGLDWEITASPKAAKDKIGLAIRLDESSDIHSQGYKLTILPEKMEIVASAAAGAFYGACTLAQILRQTGDRVPCLTISDWPDIPVRGVMLDINRDKIPTMETLYHLVDLLAGWKINQLQLYMEHTFAYLAHPAIWEKSSSITGEDIFALDAYCKARFVELVPNQNSFGHLERWFEHDKYRKLSEAPNGCQTPWGWFSVGWSLCPTDKKSISFLEGLYEELLPHFSSDLFHAGADETIDIGCGRSKEACQERGTDRVFYDFLLDIYRLAQKHGKTPMYWGDQIVQYYKLMSELPKDVIVVDWGYAPDSPFLEHGARVLEAGLSLYVCPSTCTWTSLAGRTNDCIDNISHAARSALKLGASGLLNSDWGDSGHWHPISVAYLGLLVGAMASWNAKAEVRNALVENLSLHGFGDRTGKAARAFYDLGNIYQVFTKNPYIPWLAMFTDNPAVVEGREVTEFETMLDRVNHIAGSARGHQMTSADADVVHEELGQVIRMLQLAGEMGRFKLGGPKPKDLKSKIAEVKAAHQRLWLLRNRPGGLEDSLARMKA